MQNHNDLVKKYRQADADHRLALFLEYPTLRAAFIQIDQNEYGPKMEQRGESFVKNSNHSKSLLGQVRRLFQ